MAERQLPKLKVAGSSPVSRSKEPIFGSFLFHKNTKRTVAKARPKSLDSERAFLL